MPPFDPQRLLRQDLSDFPPYSMGHVPFDDLSRLIKLDLNENPFGPSPKALDALAKMPHYNRYVGQEELRADLAHYIGVDVSHIVAGNGADEMIDLVERVFLNRDDGIVDCPPSFEMYGFFARLNGARVLAAPRREDFSLDVDAIERWVTQAGPKLVFLANPNNPDGGMVPSVDIERLLKLPTMIVLDEAYAEFAGQSWAARVPTQPNLIVLRTFSKWAGMASLRMGYCIAPQPIAEKILRVKAPENVNSAAIVAARASLDDLDYILGNVRRIVEERKRLAAELAKLGLLPLPSHANFVLCKVAGRDAKELRDALARRDILIRVFDSPRMRGYARIGIGTSEQNDQLLRVLKEIG